MKLNTAILCMFLGLGLAACATPAGVSTLPTGRYEAECASPSTLHTFKHRGFHDNRLEGSNTLVLTSQENVVYYNIPAGTACRIQTENNNNNEQQIN